MIDSKHCIEVFRCSSGVKQDNSKRHALKILSTWGKRETTIVDEQPRLSGSRKSKMQLSCLSRHSSVPVKAQHNAAACRMFFTRHTRPRHLKRGPVQDLCTQTSKCRWTSRATSAVEAEQLVPDGCVRQSVSFQNLLHKGNSTCFYTFSISGEASSLLQKIVYRLTVSFFCFVFLTNLGLLSANNCFLYAQKKNSRFLKTKFADADPFRRGNLHCVRSYV